MQVPYDPEDVARVVPQATKIAQPMMPDAAQNAVPAAMRGFGDQLERSGSIIANEALEQQRIYNDADAKERMISFHERLGQLNTDYHSLEGKNAVEGFEAYKAKVEALRDETLNGATNRAVRRQLDATIPLGTSNAILGATEHAARAQKTYADQQAQSLIGTAAKDAASPEKLEAALQIADQQTEERAKLHGWSDAEKKFEAGKARDTVWGTSLLAQADINPQAALARLNANKDKLSPLMADEVEKKILSQMVTVGSRAVAESASSGSFLQKLGAKESGNDPNAHAATSSASGRFQFTDATWRMVARKHPELNLTDKNDDEQQFRAIKAFTADNAKDLQLAGFDPSEKNLYMAHFLGSAGAVRFLRGMGENQAAPATQYVDRATASANKSIFYNSHGENRTAGEVFALLTKNFSGEAPTLKDRIVSGRLHAAAILPEDKYGARSIEFQDAVEQRIITQENVARKEERETRWNHLMTVQEVLYDANPPKSVDELLARSDVKEAYEALPEKDQYRIRQSILAMNKRDANEDTEERAANYHALLGMAMTKPQTFLESDLEAANLTNRQRAELTRERKKMLKTQQADPRIAEAMTYLDRVGVFQNIPTLDKAKPGSPKRDQFAGQLAIEMKRFQERTGHEPGEEDIKKMVGDLVRQRVQPKWFGLSTSSTPRWQDYPEPEEEKKIIAALNKAGRPATRDLIQFYYNKSREGQYK